MDGADITQCEFKYTNNPTVDKFICNDRYGVSKNAPIYDTTRNTIDISTQVIKKNVSSTVTTATFIATFDRPVNTGDLKDFPLLTNSQNMMIWAFGPISSKTIMVHSNTDYGSGQIFYLSLPSNSSAFKLIGSGLALLCGLLYSVLL